MNFFKKDLWCIKITFFSSGNQYSKIYWILINLPWTKLIYLNIFFKVTIFIVLNYNYKKKYLYIFYILTV